MKKQRKSGKCLNCCPTGGAIFRADYGHDLLPVWKCCNCNRDTPRRQNKRPTESTPLTKSQIDAITRIQQYKLRGDRVVKQFSIVNLGSVASVVVVVGSPTDEGTLAAVLCRDRGHFFVGRGGSIEAVDAENKSKAKKYPLIYGWRH